MKFLRNAALLSFLILVGVIVFGYIRLTSHRGVDVPLIADAPVATSSIATTTDAATGTPAVPPPTLAETSDATSVSTATPAIITSDSATSSLQSNGLLQVGIGKTGTWSGMSLFPIGLVEDSRCPVDATCIQAGKVRVRVQTSWGTNTQSNIFSLGEPVLLNGFQITMTDVSPLRKQNQDIQLGDYVMTFSFVPVTLTYQNATSDDIAITLPAPGGSVGRQFLVQGSARGKWYFEGSFPVEVRGSNDGLLASGIAKASGNWMTENLVPFIADISLPDSASGTATVILNRDNPSGLSANVASVSFPITITN